MAFERESEGGKRARRTVRAVRAASLPVILLGFMGSACKATTDVPPAEPTLQVVRISPGDPTAVVGTQVHFTASGGYSDGTSRDLTSTVQWSSSNAAVGVFQDSPRGLFVAVSPGTVTVSAAQGGLTGSTTATVVPTLPPATPTSVQVSPASPSPTAGATVQMSAAARYSDGSTRDVTATATWTSSDPLVAAFRDAAQPGLLSALAAGTTTVSAAVEGVSGGTTVTVSSVTLRSVSVIPASASVSVGSTLQLSAQGLYSDGSTRDLTTAAAWTSSDPAVASFSGSTPGLLAGLSPGAVTVTATAAGRSGTGSVTVASAPAGTFPLRVAAGGRYLEDQAGNPFRVQGEAAWSLIANLTATEAETYLENRRLKGFNVVIANLIEHQFAANAPNNRANVPPFTTPGDLSTPNDAYFDFALSIVQKARGKGIAVFLAPAYLGYGGGSEGWFSVMSANTPAQCLSYGRYVGAKFAAMDNVVWVQGGDYTPPSGSAGETCALQVMAGIKQGSSGLQTGHWSPGSTSFDEPNFASSMQVNSVYQYLTPQQLCRSAFARSPAVPAYLSESGYENETNQGSTPPTRKYQYWGQLTCIGGQVFGNRPIWLFASGWQAAMESQGSRDMVRLGQLFSALPWKDLLPSGLGGMRTLVTSGGGTAGGQDYVAAAATPDGKALVAYVPPTGTTARTFTVDLGATSTPVTAYWYNPTSGASVAIGTFPTGGLQQFSTPGDNGTGTNDWVLVATRG
jgi:hypothetical protein